MSFKTSGEPLRYIIDTLYEINDELYDKKYRKAEKLLDKLIMELERE